MTKLEKEKKDIREEKVQQKEEISKITAEQRKEVFAKAKKEIQLVNLEKTETRTYNTFSKDKLRTYLKNPMANQANIRGLSKYLFRMSQPYRRLCYYNAEMIDLRVRSVIPTYSLTSENNVETVKANYEKTLKQLDKMSLENELLKMFVIAWREDCAYGVTYEDDTGFFILPLDGDYCRVSSINFDSTFNFAFDFSYFRTKPEQLVYYGDPFTKMYNKYVSDPALRWQEIDPSRGVCFKINTDDPTLPLPPYIALFNSIIDLCDLAEIQAVKDELSIYKLLVARLKPLSGTSDPDDFEVDIATAIEYYNKLAESLPKEVAACISPLPIEAIEFNKDSTKDVNQMAEATKNLYNSSGGAQILNSSTITGGTAFTAAIMADSDYALASMLPQVTKWVNRYLTSVLGDHAKVKYLEVSHHTKEAYKEGLIEAATYGLPNRLAINALNGYSELETLSMQFLEIDVLGLDKLFVPLSSTYTMPSDSKVDTTETDPITGGAPTKTTATGLTDAGEASRDKKDNAN